MRGPERDPVAVRLTVVLAEVRFPARRWQLVTQADHDGADLQSRIELDRLPEGLYRDLDTVISMVTSTVAPRVASGESTASRPSSTTTIHTGPAR